MKKIILDNRTGRIVDERRIKENPWWRLAAAFILTAIFSMLPDFHLEKYLGMEQTDWFDTMQHGGYYFLLTLLLFYLLPHERRSVPFFLAIFFISVAFEFLQILIPGRTFSLQDITSNFLGIAAAFLVKYLIASLKGTR